ncbi:Rpn family recombination-promoting nuclease/putative transposase [Desulfallas thermosapovorans]|jgi:predicted transposase YdaD|uniref:Putative transposase YdaD n=1 Tax=Desulfallas thermosapovorans DSM 6562 TaxID=1121431 RepID=A0A5S4ZRY7_9FIRM|nr:Rpn family recombination-promoting nuclease/putative transposase [Desulfallas thermosapovorans]TYO95509.1 putative transposase YdaD [Desulfallas thermosapovorans DSM 6562]
MPKIDIPVKKLIELRPADWARYIQPGCREEWVTNFKTSYTPKKESRLDSILKINDPNGPYLLNLEPMGYRDNALPARMLRYRSDIWEATLTEGKGLPSIRQVVIFFYHENDNGLHRLRDTWDKGILEYAYEVIRVWEQRRQPVITAKLVGLYPLLPLMKGENEQETPEQALKECMSVVQEVEDKSLQLDLLAVMAIMAGGRFPEKLVLSMIRREMVMESPIFQEWVKEERAEAEARGEARGRIKGKAEGKAEGKVEAICKYLEVRFGPASAELQRQVRNISSLDELNRIINNIYTTGTVEEARAVVLGTRN